MSMSGGQGESFSTPRRVQKCLFTSGSNSCRKSLYQNPNENAEMSSGEESDLGPMSPLAFTDRSPSTCDSSSGREFISPCATPDKSLCTWDRLTSLNRRVTDGCLSPFSALKKLTKAARYSPRYKVFNNNSPRSLPSSPSNVNQEPLTPKRSKMISTADEIIPETPQRSFANEIQNQSIMETPRKSMSPGYRLVTPLGSITKLASLPKMHRRKSLGTLKMGDSFSPEQKENTLKRHARDQLPTNPTKLFKVDDTSAPKARAALFQERMNEFSLKNFSLSTKTFYNGCNGKSERPFVVGGFRFNDVKRRRSLPPQSSSGGSNRRLLKRQRFGRINAGVFHAIKKPKPKVNPEELKKEGKQRVAPNSAAPDDEPARPMEESAIATRAPSPEIDENKRFFKTNKTIRTNQAATVTVSNTIKLKVADGKIVLNQKRPVACSSTNARKQRAKPQNVSYDVADLSVDEPEVEGTLQQDKVANILKVLENDWADDDYDTMEPLTTGTSTVSPTTATTLPQDTIMSPASELSNMTSTLNIEDLTSSTSLENHSTNNNDSPEINKQSEAKYFPLFTKGYQGNLMPVDIFEDTNATKSKEAKRNTQWQLSAKGGGGEDQYQLDVGQKRFGATQCPECNVVYQLGDPEDENAHLNYHNSIRILKFQGWKTERVMMEDTFTSSRIIMIEPHDSKQCWKKVSEILAVVDRDLGLADMQISDYESKKVFLYIREKSVLGVLVAEHIETAHRMIPELIELDCCTAESTPTKCGINVVWTAMSHRRQGIATKLIDTLRAKFFYGYVMSMDDIAFSTPSPSGKIFAEKYTKTRNFKVYS